MCVPSVWNNPNLLNASPTNQSDFSWAAEPNSAKTGHNIIMETQILHPVLLTNYRQRCVARWERSCCTHCGNKSIWSQTWQEAGRIEDCGYTGKLPSITTVFYSILLFFPFPLKPIQRYDCTGKWRCLKASIAWQLAQYLSATVSCHHPLATCQRNSDEIIMLRQYVKLKAHFSSSYSA